MSGLDTERCPLCRRGRVVQTVKELSPEWCQRYGELQLYKCKNCRRRFIAHDCRLLSIRRCHHCTQWFVPTEPEQRWCGVEHQEAWERQCLIDLGDNRRQQVADLMAKRAELRAKGEAL